MKKTTPNILILGGGVAGMAAAQTFADQDVAVHLVERKSALGGHAAMWACMATDTCQNCGACLSIEMADQVQKQENVISHLDTIVETINKAKQGYKVILENKETFNVEKIIMATGFSPFNPVQINSLHYDEYKNVITTAELNTILQKETLSGYFNGKPDPKIAFIQCVGSRNREQGKDFCSQVCCKISMRHANKLTHLFPESDITLFYMDLQIIGKEVRPLFKTLSNNIALVQGVPAEILEDTETNMLTIVAEDKE
ncbi:MAG: FAD-dependent oxidoreductase, partial [Desulfobacula sp.]|nr:FAD-dependent oxidoreductase [Desulfobacula sp.]